MRTKSRFALWSIMVVFCLPPRGAARPANGADAVPISCRVLESHTSTSPAVTVVVFHQQSGADQARLAAGLRAHSGNSVEMQVEGGRWTSATIFRLKSCFGRGLLVLAPNSPVLKDGDVFLIRFVSASAKN